MSLTYVPLLRVQREIYELPRGMERFREYLRTMLDESADDLELPLVGMNPMAKEHVPALLDRCLAMDLDAVAAAAVAEVEWEGGDDRVALVVSDDLHGGWTNRYAAEFTNRFGLRPMLKRGWIVGTIWTSEEPSAARVREEILTAIHRTSWLARHGYPKTLGARMLQEGFAMRRAGAAATLDGEDLEYTRAVLEPLLDHEDMPTTVVGLFGDPAADSLGFPRLGLSRDAGLQLALRETHGRSSGATAS